MLDTEFDSSKTKLFDDLIANEEPEIIQVEEETKPMVPKPNQLKIISKYLRKKEVFSAFDIKKKKENSFQKKLKKIKSDIWTAISARIFFLF